MNSSVIGNCQKLVVLNCYSNKLDLNCVYMCMVYLGPFCVLSDSMI